MKYFSLLLLLVVVFLAFFVRVFQVDTRPSGVLIDEASFGYNSFSLLETGKDEHGTSYPLIFKAFGDQKLPAYTYTLIPFIQYFGLNNFAVRLPSVIAGTLVVLLSFFLLRKFEFSESQSLIGSLIVAVSPWTIILSRFAYESNLALLFLISGLVAFFSYIKTSKLWLLLLSGAFFGFTWYSYIAYRLVVPIVAISLIAFFLWRGKRNTRHILFFCISALIVVLPLLSSVFSHEGTARLQQTGIFKDAGVVLEVNENRTFCNEDLPGFVCTLVYNKPVVISRMLVERYIDIFSFEFLFFFGEESRHISVSNFGLLPYFLLPFYIVGICSLFINIFRKKSSTFQLFCLFGLLITPLPAVLAGDPQRVRLSAFFPFVLLTIVYGIAITERIIKRNSYKNYYYIGVSFLLLFFGIIFMVSYLAVHVKKNDISYASHIPKLIKYLDSKPESMQLYINSFPEAIHYYSYFAKLPPGDFQKSAKWNENKHNGFAHVVDFKNIHTTEKNIKSFVCDSTIEYTGSLYVTNREEEGFEPIELITNYDTIHPLYYIYDLESQKKTACEDTSVE